MGLIGDHRRRRLGGAAGLLPLLVAATGGLVCLGALIGIGRPTQPQYELVASASGLLGSGRRLLQHSATVSPAQTSSPGDRPGANDKDGRHRNNGSACTPRSVEAFPPDLFTLEQKRQGAILLHSAVCVWLFAALAIVCDDYFVASLEVVCSALHLKPDVAGATFMAAGNSSTQLVAAVIGVFLAESDVGVGTIVGSAIFNNLMIVSLCGLAATQVVRLSTWPLFRDCSFYAFSVAVLVAIIHDGVVHWYESAILITLLATYITVMVFNSRLDRLVHRCWPAFSARGSAEKQVEETTNVESGEEKRTVGGLPKIMEIWSVEMTGLDGNLESSGGSSDDVALVEVQQKAPPESIFAVPEGALKRAYWLFTLPWAVAFRLTIPDCRRPGIWKRLFALTFIFSVVWIWGLVYLLVWMVCSVGDAMGIPDTVMGLTLLAIGTCIPDALAGVFVAKTGLGDMAIANALASNVFDITACLGIPWFIRTALLRPGSTVIINSAGLTYTSITLLSTVLFLLVAVWLNKMRVGKKLGLIFLVVYASVATLACLYETNVFGPFNPPPCPRTRV